MTETMIDVRQAAVELDEGLRKLLHTPEDLESLVVRPARFFYLPRSRGPGQSIEIFLQDRFTTADLTELERALEAGQLEGFCGRVLDRLKRKYPHPSERWAYAQVLKEEEALLWSLIEGTHTEAEADALKDRILGNLGRTFPGSAVVPGRDGVGPTVRPLITAHHAYLVRELTTYAMCRMQAPPAPPAAGKKKERKNG